jgi:hypothetical protein
MILPLLMSASPVLAQTASDRPSIQLPPQLTDPATAQKLANAMQALSSALLNVRIGEVHAALEGRHASAQERNLTVGDLARRKDPNFDRDIQRQVANIGPTLQRSMTALNEALPEVARDIDHAQKALERAAANMPDPNYPKR